MLAELSSVDTLFLATFTYGRGIGGRQPRGTPLGSLGWNHAAEPERGLLRLTGGDAGDGDQPPVATTKG